MTKRISFWRNDRGDAVVEAAILFPIMIMIFAAFVLLAVYLPTRAVLQNAAQYAAVALATEESDTWLEYDENAMTYYYEPEPGNVYMELLWSFFSEDQNDIAKKIVSNREKGEGLVEKPGTLTVECNIINYVVYKEIIVTATREIPMPVDLSFIYFPKVIPVTVSASAVVQNGDEFIRDMDIAADLADYFAEKYDLKDTFGKVGEYLNKFYDFMGI